MRNFYSDNPKVRARIEVGKIRLRNILRKHVIANARTLEQKISDSGPFGQRVDPALLSVARNELMQEGILERQFHLSTPWYFLKAVRTDLIQERLDAQLPIHEAISGTELDHRIGQALEIAIYKGLQRQSKLMFLGGFPDLDTHDDSSLYKKSDPPKLVNGLEMPGTLDFLVISQSGTLGGIEAKNVRPWIYPDDDDVLKPLLLKCCISNVLPVLIARRVSYVAFSEILFPCGIVVHETYNQLYPLSAVATAALASDKNLLGYHDIRTTNEPNNRLLKFLHIDLPELLPDAVEKFRQYRPILLDFAQGNLSYADLRRHVGV